MKCFLAAALALVMIIALVAKVSFANCGTCGKTSGTVKAVDVEGKKITCTKECGAEVVVTVADDAKITVNDKEAKLGDVKPGDKIACEGEDKGDQHIAKTISIKRE
jgi:Cu/Ag efflux protein CusF